VAKTAAESSSAKKIWVVKSKVAAEPLKVRTRTWMWTVRPEYQPGSIVSTTAPCSGSQLSSER
jgi:hypothetical protein